jgi:hypothetical protein
MMTSTHVRSVDRRPVQALRERLSYSWRRMNTWLRAGSAIGVCAISLISLPSAAGESAGQSRYGLATDAAACAALEGHQFGKSHITAATFVRPPYYTRWMSTSRTATVLVPFCRLEVYADPVPRSHIEFEVWLPARASWNGRYLGIGAGGSMGAINTNDMADGVNRGFASVATNNGHRSPGPRDGNEWALRAPERIVDFGHRANHIATGAGKAMVQAYYGRLPQFAYFFGCSQGGHKGMMEAERYPEDFDGIVAGAPVYSWVNEMTQQAWNVRALTETPRSAITREQLQALQDAALKKCAGANGLIADPRQCDFDPVQLQCVSSDGKTCLSPEQVTAVRKIYDGPHTSDGRAIFPGMARQRVGLGSILSNRSCGRLSRRGQLVWRLSSHGV